MEFGHVALGGDAAAESLAHRVDHGLGLRLGEAGLFQSGDRLVGIKREGSHRENSFLPAHFPIRFWHLS